LLAGAGGIEPCNNPLPHKDFSIPARPFDSIFDSKAKALVGMTDDEVAYIEAKGWKASVVPELSIPPLRELLWIKRRSFEVRHARRRLPAESALMSAARGNADSFSLLQDWNALRSWPAGDSRCRRPGIEAAATTMSRYCETRILV
jgi:hypothetical protein